MAGHLISIDTHLCILPVGVGETWCRMMDKYVLAVAGPEVKEDYGMDKFCGGMEAGI